MNLKHIIITVALMLLMCGTASAWLTGYDYRIPITVNNGGASELTYYQFNFTNDTNVLVAAGHMQASGADCRITDASDNLLPFWNETPFNAAGTKIWVNATTLAVGDNTFYMYYGNAAASSAANGETTFKFFDDFEVGCEKSWWTTIVDDTDYAYQGFIENLPNNSIYLSPLWDDTAGSNTSYARPYLLDAVYLYAITGNQTYLDAAEQAADDLERYTLNTTTNISADWDWQNEQVLSSSVTIRAMGRYLRAVALIAHYNSSYLPLAQKLRSGVIDNYYSSNDLVYYIVYPNGAVDDNSYWIVNQWYVGGLLSMYALHDDTVSKNKLLDLIEATWSLRNTDTNLIGEKFNADTEAKLISSAREYDTLGSFLELMDSMYYLSGNTTVKQHIEDFSEAIATYAWDSNPGAFNYRTNDDGSVNNDVQELLFHMLDNALLMANDISPNATVKSRAKDDFDWMFMEGNDISSKGVLFHKVTDTGEVSYSSSVFHATVHFPYSTYSLYRANDYNMSYITKAQYLYNDLVSCHKRTTTKGYVAYTDGNDCANDADNPLISPSGLSLGANAVSLLMVPSSGVNITWFENHNHVPIPPRYLTAPLFNKVHLEFASKNITLDNVTGAGNITFGVKKITSAKKDGTTYTDFSGNVLTTVSGSHSYTVIVETNDDETEGGLFPSSNWHITGTLSATASSEEQSVSPTHSVKQSGSLSEDRGADGDMGSQQSGMHVYDFHVRFSQNDLMTLFFAPTNTPEWYSSTPETSVVIRANGDGNIVYYNETNSTIIDGYNANQWYHWEIVLKPTTKKFDMKIDGVPKVIDGGFRGDEQSPRYVHLHNRHDSTGIFYIDNFIIRQYTATEPAATLGAEETGGSSNNIVIGANKYGMLRKDVSSAQTFSTIESGFSHDVCFTWWDDVSDTWKSYWVGDSYNSGQSIPKDESYFVLMDSTGETVSCSVASAATVSIPYGWSVTYLRESDAKTLSSIKADMGGNCADLYAWDHTASGTGAWTNTGSYTVLPNQGLLVSASSSFNWDGSVS